MIIVLAPEQLQKDESFIVNRLFENGLELFHVRKRGWDDGSIQHYIGTIDGTYRERLVLHGHHHLADDLGLRRLHFSEADRRSHKQLLYQENFLCSTSVHSMADFNALPTTWVYAFLSPVFPSISKQGYGMQSRILEDLKLKNNASVPLIGLGGIDENNFRQVREAGADGGALLGCIWQRNHSLETFMKCKQIDQLY